MLMDSHRILLDGATNARDLGGFPAENGKTTRTGLFIRCDATHRLSEKDIFCLKDTGVKTVIDLRGPDELVEKPSLLMDQDFLEYKNVTLLDQLREEASRHETPIDLGLLYIQMLETSKIGFGRLFQLFLQSSEKGGCLFHCAAGKDRTGLSAMLLLMLAGVPDDLIEADYHATEIYQADARKALLDELKEEGITVPEELFLAPSSAIRKAMQHIRDTYGSARKYLLSCGFKECDCALLVERFTV